MWRSDPLLLLNTKQYRGSEIYRKAEQAGQGNPLASIVLVTYGPLLVVVSVFRHRFCGISDSFAPGLRNPRYRPCAFPFRNDGLFHFSPHPCLLSSINGYPDQSGSFRRKCRMALFTSSGFSRGDKCPASSIECTIAPAIFSPI